MTERPRPRGVTIALAMVSGAVCGVLALVGCAAPAAPAETAATTGLGAPHLDRFRGDDGLFHDHNVRGLDGALLAEGGLDEGLWTTAAVARLLQTEGGELRLGEAAGALVDAAAARATPPAADPSSLARTAAPGVQTLVGAARVCVLTDRASAACAGAVEAARLLLGAPGSRALAAAHPVALIEAAADLGVDTAAPGTAQGTALGAALAADDPCARSATIRHRVRFDRLGALTRVPEPRALADAVVTALRAGDIEEALCRSGLAAAAVGGTPERDEDWLREPFAAAVAEGFERSHDGWFRARGSDLGRVEVTRMLSQVSFDLSVVLA